MAAAAVQRQGGLPPQRYQGVQKESAGYRLLSAMGWREGEGLGASKQGIKAHIKVKKKFENWGVGAVEAAEHAQTWTNGMLDFHRVLSNLSEVVSEHARRRADGSSSDEDSDASGGEQAPEQQAAEKPRQPRRQRKEGGGKKRRRAAPSSGSGSGGSEGEGAGVAAPKRVKAATHLGRFKKREAAKMVKGYSQHDLAAILGEDPFASFAAAVPEVRAQQVQQAQAGSSGYDTDESSGGDSDAGGGSQAAAATAAAAVAQAAKPEMIVVRRPMAASGGGGRPAAPPPAPPDSGQPEWWQVCFHRAAGPRAGVGASAAAPAAITIHGFSEQDQTNLYNMAHDKATKGRVGLGRGGMPKKVAGARWEGQKTRIADSSDEEEEEEEAEEGGQEQGRQAGPAPVGVELEREEGMVIILPASKRHLLDQLQASSQQVAAAGAPAASPQQRQRQEGQAPASKKAKKATRKAAAAAAGQQPAAAGQLQQQQPEEPAAACAGLGRIKWKKAVSAALKASAKGRLKLGKLHKAVAREHGVAKAQHGAALQALTAFLHQSPKFELADGVVRAARG
ncbi:hypothetical protein CHLNCDRAFT_135612 [Chlorella variabilis]|uniref:G-patch domain-containing protein n=1 Tax=Chlorella variabilis TaxID=554065 RepID=E1ZIK7_CHLVA|nr:hypothetical protein CHLNCDRAFT_135612 [Chlorella variabilis]EFN54351.1 hypothetical protein CHLNCDRAFT_135612 [Chlorella variabilis]|eukprot:XP_005846453.1 hypothetical protein CHLNCDRAFT_135612 [Chlorella variabilis]